jgi:hypothetical protein
MRIFCAAAMLTLLAGPAFAQSLPSVGDSKKEDKPKSQLEIDSERAAERAYKKSLGNIPDQGPGDPWGGARNLDTPKAASKPAATKAATGKKNTAGAN